MGAQRTSFEKLQRDRNKKAKQALKRERRQTGEAGIGEDGEEILVELSTEGELSAAELLAQIELIHKQLDDKVIDFDEFEERKTDLMARLPID
ncbi:MAG: hypothetical protein F2947_05075 [Actinobacteria bacterium]|uniref:Unannotated protein n=1 Tax=freshwater metagenome TaxID=449393 RepID=A0A6J6WHV2_9ZZZZ|nr:hypothetical protein [Actinomycetota bacterium]MSX34640.1 hypothetical protein [Actinomycetota bacterium]MSX95463.1 hypothetical protein [Actinomycetota bacterium]MSY25060.1 hypothetical protein [Actinomycetota bacterium]MSY33640.1 hypothetical protein [Actinomycetota bacterium]